MSSSETGLAPRERAHTILHEVLDRRRPLDEVLQTDRRFARLADRDRAFARNLVATTLRRLGQIDAIIDGLLDRPLPRSAAAARNALRLGACQLLFLDTRGHAAVDTSVTLAARRGPDRFRGVVNAILRRISKIEPESIGNRYPVSLNMPEWLAQSWTTRYGAAATAAIIAQYLEAPPTDITVKTDAAGWAETLGGTAVSADTVRLERAGDITALQGFAEGAWWIQDAAAALPVRLLGSALAKSGNAAPPVADLCAAPGGKTAQLAAAGFDVTAIDVSADRLETLGENMARLGLTAATIEADLTRWTPPAPFAGVLLDAPCTATGTMRRHPDIPHLKRSGDVIRQADLQKKLLDRMPDFVAPGGVLVYSVCSLQPEEGIERVNDFLAANDLFERCPVRPGEAPAFDRCITADGDMVTLPLPAPAEGGLAAGFDGFFIARFRRREDR
jgi:16S rRNA (cytosine967-C5)-methyltransferase